MLREMGRTAIMAALGLTAVLSMGGGVLNIIDLEQLTAGQLARIMSIIVPVAATLALPVATLYAAAASYGRLSADNEFVACRASGINIWVLFLPALAISVVMAGVTFFFINNFIPNRIRSLDRLLRSDPTRILLQALHAPERLALTERVRAYADQVDSIPDESGNPQVRLHRAAFIEMDEEGWVRCGTGAAAAARLLEGGIRVDMQGVTLWDPRRGRFFSEERLPLQREEIPQFSLIRRQLKWLTLGELLAYRRTPTELPQMVERLERLRRAIAAQWVYRQVVRDYAEDLIFALEDRTGRYELSAVEGFTEPDSFKPTFADVTLNIQMDSETRTATASEAALEIDVGADESVVDAFIRLRGRVTWTSSRNPGQKLAKAADQVGPILIEPPDMSVYTSDRLLDTSRPIDLEAEVERGRGQMVHDLDADLRDIDGLIHSRLAFSGSVVVLVILAAALGIILRGAHVLTAFGISFIPSLFVCVMIIMGRQLAKNEGSETVGLGLMWLAIAVAGVLDIYVITRVLRR